MSITGTPMVGRACLTASLALTAWLATPSPAGATTLRRIDLPELVHRADLVVHARAIEKKVYWNAAGTQIHTDTLFDILDHAKGQGQKRLTVTMLGGRIGPVEMSADGTPVFEIGEEVLLFTSPRPDGMKNLVGYSQGVMRVHEDPQTGEKVAASEVPVGTTYLQDVGGRARATHPARLQAPLPELLDRIRQMVAAERTAPGLSRKPVPAVPVSDGGRP